MKKSFFILLVFLIFTPPLILNAQIYYHWSARYNGTGNGVDESYAIAKDVLQNIYITGKTYGSTMDCGTIKYNQCGDLIWTNIYNYYDYDYGYDITVDHQNYVLVSGETYASSYYWTQFLALKYNISGTQIWYKSVGGSKDDFAERIAVDNGGNIFLAGTTEETDLTWNYMIVKLDPNSNVIWTKYYGATGYDDRIYDMTVDQNSNVYVTGFSYGDVNSYIDWATLKYDANGNLLWAARYNGNADDADVAYSLAVDDYGNVYVTGVTREYEIPPGNGDGGQNTFTTIKYNSSGIQQWINKYFGGGFVQYAKGNSITLANNEPIATGHVHQFNTTLDGINDYATIKYNPYNGTRIWTALYGYAIYGNDQSKVVKTDGYGNIFVTGTSQSINLDPNSYDIATIKYNTNGEEQWNIRYNTPYNLIDKPHDMILDNDVVYVTGTSTWSTGSFDYITIKYSPRWLISNCNEDNKFDNNYNIRNLKKVNDSSAIAIGEQGMIMRTSNSGLNWTNISMLITCRFNDIYFNNSKGLIAGENGTILSTSNSGNNWILLRIPINYEINAVQLLNASTVWCAGVKGTLFKSTNSGITWLNKTFDTSYNFNSLYFINLLNGFIVGSNGTIIATSNGGTSWNSVYSGTTNQLNKILFKDLENGIIIGKSGTILISSNSGITWLKKQVGYTNDLNGVYYLSSKAIYIVGSSGLILRSSNNGINWMREQTDISSDLTAVTFLDSNRGIATGNDGSIILTSKGELYYNYAGDYLNTNDYNKTADNTNYRLNQNYPNPFNPETEISFYIPENSKVNLSVYDVTGRLVSELVNDYRTKGNYNVKFIGTNLSSGIYFYKLIVYDEYNNNEKYSFTKKMVILK